jgi:DHA1 family bicyclomycin/chloramphenicol resistance-like MFS transporter
MAGSLLLSLGGWREIFWVVAGLGALGLVTAFATLGESLPPQNRQPLSAGAMAQSYLTLLRDRSLVWLTLAGACWSGATFTFLSVSSFVFTGEFHFSPLGYGLVFGVCASGMILSSQFNARLMQAIGAKAQLQRVSFAALAASAGLLAASSLHLAGAPVVIVGCFLLFACQGLSLAPAQVTVLDRHPSMAGAASALMGTVQMTLGAVASSLAATTFSPTSRTLILMQFACMILIVVLVRIAFSSGEGRGGLESSAEA